MYYKRVNRGLSFTKQGFYLFGFILLIGMLAVITGINAFYTILSAMLGLFVVSGVLSERVIKHSSAYLNTPEIAGAGEPIEMAVKWENTGNFGVYNIEMLVLPGYPKYRMVKKKIDSYAFDRAELDEKSTKISLIKSQPLQRGVYREFILLHQTVFPFGLLEKYKFKREKIDLSVFPKMNHNFLMNQRELSNLVRSIPDSGPDFSGYDRFDFSSWRNLDWRRNAFKRQTNWVVRVFKEEEKVSSIAIIANWSLARDCRYEHEYEEYLENIATILMHTKKMGFLTVLSLDEKTSLLDFKQQLKFLATCPKFTELNKDILFEFPVPFGSRDYPLALRFVSINRIIEEIPDDSI
jgi:hypothetical protein